MTAEGQDRARAYPFVKWAGGKRALVPEIGKVLPETFGDYWEPFVGGGAVFFALDSHIRKAYLSDTNLDLILTYKALAGKPEIVIRKLQEHARKHSKRYYLEVRDCLHDEQDVATLAAQFIYLNKTCYNGLYRVNKQGRFNVPQGRHKSLKICDEGNLRAASKVLGKANLRVRAFDKIEPKRGDLVYCDPPYDGTFSAYTGNGFGDGDQKALRDASLKWRKAGAHVIVSNSDTDLVRRLYGRGKFTIHKVSGQRYINRNSAGRGKEQELLIVA